MTSATTTALSAAGGHPQPATVHNNHSRTVLPAARNLTQMAHCCYMRGTRRLKLLSVTSFSLGVYPRPAEFTARDSPGGMVKVTPCQRRLTLSAA